MPISGESGREFPHRLQTRSRAATMMDASFNWDSSMKRAIVVALGVAAVIGTSAAIGIGSTTTSAMPQSMSRLEYHGALRAVDESFQAERCESLAETARELCRAEVSAGRLVRVAEIESSYRRDEQSARALQRARIEARYQVERAHCASLSGFKRDRCLVRAHAAKGRAMLEAAGPYEVRFTP